MSAVKYFIQLNMKKLRIDEFLARELNSAGYGGVDIRKMPMKTEVVVYASRPGVVIGRRGAKIRELTDVLENEFGVENVQLEVTEVENSWINAQVMASRLARQLERGVRYRRMAYWILRRIIRAGALGCEIIVRGKLGSRRARYQKFKYATIPKSGEPSSKFVDEAVDYAILKPGIIGVKVRILRPNSRLPGVIFVKTAKKKDRQIELVKRPQPTEVEEEEAVPEEVEEGEEDVPARPQEGFEGISDLDELRELEELDDMDLLGEDHDASGSGKSDTTSDEEDEQ